MNRIFALAVALASAQPAFAAPPSEVEVDPAFAALVKAAPLSLSEDELRKAGAADAQSDVPVESLLNRLEVKYDAEGRARTLRHIVLRYRTREAVETYGTFDVPYAPWFEDKPVIRGRVVPARGAGFDIDPRTIAETSAKEADLIVSDRKNLAVPLPHLAVGATVEIVVEQSDHKAPYGSSIRNGWQATHPATRATIVQIEAPAALTPRVKLVGLEARMTETKADGNVRRRIESYRNGRGVVTDQLAHGVMWAVGKGSWDALAKSYGETIAPVIAGPTGWAPATGTRREKVAAIVERVAKELRYTGLHLGDAAVVPFSPKDVIARGYGDCKDLAALVVRALGEAGVPAQVVLLRVEDALAIDPEMAGLDLFDHAIAYVPADGAEPALWVDATAPEFGVGALPSADLERLVLLVDPKTAALTPTPARATPENADVFHIDITYRPEPIGPGKVALTYTFGGDERYTAHRLYAGQDPKPFENLKRTVMATFGGEIASARVDSDDATKPIAITFELADVRRLDSDGRSHKLTLGMDSLQAHFDRLLMEADRHVPLKLARGVDMAIRYRVVPPSGYQIAELPKDAQVVFGPFTWSVHFAKGADGVVEATGNYLVPKLDLTAKEVGETLDREEERGKSMTFPIELVPDQGKLAPLERAAWFRKELAARPKDAELRARWALELDKWGLSEEARKEVDAAAKDASGPSARFVLTARARLWERDPFGRVYRSGWDRKRAVAAWRAVVALDAKSVWARQELADILVRDERGAYKKKRDKEGDEGRALLLATANEGSNPGVDRVLEAWDAVGMHAEIIRFAETWKGSPRDAIDTHWAKSVALVEGPEAVAALIESWGEPKRVQSGAASIMAAYMLARRFDDATKALDTLTAALGAGTNPLSEWSGKVRKLAPMDDFTTPDKAFQSFYSMLAGAPDDLAEKLSKLLGTPVSDDDAAEMKKLLGASALAGVVGGDGPDALWALYDMIFGVATIATEGDAKFGWQTTLSMPELGKPGADPRELGKAYFAPSGKNVRLVGFAGGPGVPMEALAKLVAGDMDGARKWLLWAYQGARFKPKAMPEEPDASTPIEAVWRAAFLLAATSPHPAQEGLAAALDAGGQYLVGDERGLVLAALARVARTDAARDQVVAVMQKQFAARAPSANEKALYARMLARVGKKDEALKVAAERLATDPTNDELIADMAFIESTVGELEAARTRYLGLRDTGRLEEGGHNELAWLDLCVGKVDDKTLESARTAAKKGNKAAVHTRAMIEIERGLLDEGAASARALAGDDEEVDASVWLVTGRMAEALGLKDLAVKYYGRVTGKNEMEGPTSSLGVARMRLQKMGVR